MSTPLTKYEVDRMDGDELFTATVSRHMKATGKLDLEVATWREHQYRSYLLTGEKPSDMEEDECRGTLNTSTFFAVRNISNRNFTRIGCKHTSKTTRALYGSVS